MAMVQNYFYVMVVIKGINEEDISVLPQRLRKIIPKHIENRLNSLR